VNGDPAVGDVVESDDHEKDARTVGFTVKLVVVPTTEL
jgi:hypothetical protein